MDLSIVIPLYNEEESLTELSLWIHKVCDSQNLSYEIIMIDDGSKDKSWEIINELNRSNKNIKGIKFQRNYGKAAALNEGFKLATGNVVITMDADLQDSPDEIPELYNMIINENYDLVSGWKKKRYDPTFTKNIPSKVFNFIARLSSGIKLHDFNCGLKAYKLNVVKSIEIIGQMHRYIPILAKNAGFNKIGEKPVIHQKRKYGVTKYGFDRFYGLLDLLTLSFISKFEKKPMHLFGSLGSLSFISGVGILIYLSIAKIVFLQYKMTERPLFFLGLLTIIFGAQLFLTGFLAEMIVRSAQDRNKYLIEEKLGS